MNNINDKLLKCYQYYYRNIVVKLMEFCEECVKELEVINPKHMYGELNPVQLLKTEIRFRFIYKIINMLTENSFQIDINKKDSIKDLAKLSTFFMTVAMIPEDELSPERILKNTESLK